MFKKLFGPRLLLEESFECRHKAGNEEEKFSIAKC